MGRHCSTDGEGGWAGIVARIIQTVRLLSNCRAGACGR